MSNPSLRTAKSNRILCALPPPSLKRLIPDLHLEPLALKRALQPRGIPLKAVVFPIYGVASMIAVRASGASIEVATIGCDGIVGLPLFLGGESSTSEIFMQVGGRGSCMAAADFQRHVATDLLFMETLLRYTQAIMSQVAQCTLCNQHHSRFERCARWGLMLSVRRATVSEIAQTLQAQGLIQYHRDIAAAMMLGGRMAVKRVRAARKRPAAKRVARRRTVKRAKKGTSTKWSAAVMERSDAMDLETGVFKKKTARQIALSLKRSVERSQRRKSPPFRSAMSMLNFEINRAGRNLSAQRRALLNQAKAELRKLFHRQPQG